MVFKVAKSRPLFKNYYSVIFKYFLFRHNLLRNSITHIKCLDEQTLDTNFRLVGYIIRLYSQGIINGIDCKRRALRSVRGFLVPIEEFMLGTGIEYALISGWGYDFKGRYWFKGSVKFKHMHWPIIETFDLGQYDSVNVDSKIVLDIGAFIGDTAIWFITRGAKRVYAVEPLPINYNEMLQNITLNNLSDKVIPMKVTISYSERRIKIPRSVSAYVRGGSISEMLQSSRAQSYEYINAVTLSELYKSLPEKPTVLKMDCEGCEFDIVLNDYNIVKEFNQIIFEYHSYITKRSIYELISILSKDFRCNFVKEELYRDKPRNMLGMLHCTKTT
ncbi:FkbM family methyltransferase [Thermogladius sp. 4427co]|uniref:FkbM family methyltransferase n=1 Tax=Thermogladius sp. 4427co TaxID=3450718 RepID=UPI003F7A6517